jgi:DNA/RNA endonuclease G (NUC1)
MINRVLQSVAACFVLASAPAFVSAASKPKPIKEPPAGYDHTRFTPKPDLLREYRAFVVSFDSKDDDSGDGKPDLLRVPHWVAQEIRKWEPEEQLSDDDKAWCLHTLKKRPDWFTDANLFRSGVAPNDDSYRNSGFDRGHMAMKLLVERLGRDAAWNTHTVLNAIPQRPKFNRGIWQNLEFLTGAWAQKYGAVWIIQGPVFYALPPVSWIGDGNERKIAVPDAAFKIVVRHKTPEELASVSDSERDVLEVLAFLYPQLGAGYFGPTKEFRHERFLTSVDEIEKLTGLDFLLEETIERRRASSLWKPTAVDLGNPRLFLSGCRDL